ncbi:hypothetical protein ACJJTC_015515 [Scirpophaga incertulas]
MNKDYSHDTSSGLNIHTKKCLPSHSFMEMLLSNMRTEIGAQRSEQECYGDSAVGYVQVIRDEDICVVKARITPEHNVRQKCYAVTCTCNETEETIISVECEVF